MELEKWKFITKFYFYSLNIGFYELQWLFIFWFNFVFFYNI